MAYKNQFTKDPDILARMQHSEKLEKIRDQEYKERRRRERRLTFSPGEHIWIGITLVFLCFAWVAAVYF